MKKGLIILLTIYSIIYMLFHYKIIVIEFGNYYSDVDIQCNDIIEDYLLPKHGAEPIGIINNKRMSK